MNSEISQGTDEKTVSRDFLDYIVNGLKNAGLIPKSTGITKQLPEVSTGADVARVVSDITSEHRARKGVTGQTLDTPVEASYGQSRYDFIRKEEGSRNLAYDDATGKAPAAGGKKGNITVGIGFNMDRPDAQSVMESVLGYDRETFNQVYSGKKSLSETEIRKLFEFNVREAEGVIQSKLGGVELSERQRVALVSMAFNSPSLIGPKLTAAIKSGDSEAAINEVLYNSGTKKIKELAGRRYREAAMLSGGKLPDFSQYIAGLSGNKTTGLA